MNLSLTSDFHRQIIGQSVYTGKANTVQTAGDFIAASAEFTAGMKNRKSNFKSVFSGFLMIAYRYSAAVVLYGNDFTFVNGDDDMVAESCHCLIDRVVHKFIDQVMETA